MGWKSGLLLLPLMLIFALLAMRLSQIQITEAPLWKSRQVRQLQKTHINPAKRGTLKSGDGDLFAYDCPTQVLTAELPLVKDPVRTAEVLSPLLGRPVSGLTATLTHPNRRVVYLARDVSEEVAGKIRKENLPGIGFEAGFKRIYPCSDLAPHVVGWAGPDGGKEGVELKLDRILRGKPGTQVFVCDAARRMLSRPASVGDEDPSRPPEHGLDVTLTLHTGIQHELERELERATAEFKPAGMAGLVMDLSTGAILAMACTPTYDVAKPGEAQTEARRNRVLTDCYEPGSTFKTFIAALALDRGLWRRNESIFCENGSWRQGYRVLHDAHAYGTLSFDLVLIKSSNIGAAKIGLRLGLQGVYEAVQLFGFGKPTRIDLPGEGKGIVRAFSKWTKDSLLSVPMGQEISVTPLQLVTAYCAMVNGGLLLRPQIVQAIRDREGREYYRLQAQPVARVIRSETSRAMREIMQDVVVKGTGRTAWCREYSIGGKTGTAQKVVDGQYSRSKYVGSFCGFAPVENPRLVCLVAVDEPSSGFYYGGTVAAPSVGRILRCSLNALGVPPRSAEEQDRAQAEFDRKGDAH